MSDEGVGLRLLVLSCSVWVGGIWGCDTADRAPAEAVEQREAAQVGDGEPAQRAPEQVVQRIVAAPEPSASARSASNGVRPAADTAVPSPKSSAAPITSKHLEAELNRLEAELGR